ncbi:MAG: hypothetical protein LBR90_03430, partial [Elusimicrobiota bacterium]|nr:hypothetical protein [Elusimicrobiota bacterium]
EMVASAPQSAAARVRPLSAAPRAGAQVFNAARISTSAANTSAAGNVLTSATRAPFTGTIRPAYTPMPAAAMVDPKKYSYIAGFPSLLGIAGGAANIFRILRQSAPAAKETLLRQAAQSPSLIAKPVQPGPEVFRVSKDESIQWLAQNMLGEVTPQWLGEVAAGTAPFAQESIDFAKASIIAARQAAFQRQALQNAQSVESAAKAQTARTLITIDAEKINAAIKKAVPVRNTYLSFNGFGYLQALFDRRTEIKDYRGAAMKAIEKASVSAAWNFSKIYGDKRSLRAEDSVYQGLFALELQDQLNAAKLPQKVQDAVFSVFAEGRHLGSEAAVANYLSIKDANNQMAQTRVQVAKEEAALAAAWERVARKPFINNPHKVLFETEIAGITYQVQQGAAIMDSRTGLISLRGETLSKQGLPKENFGLTKIVLPNIRFVMTSDPNIPVTKEDFTRLSSIIRFSEPVTVTDESIVYRYRHSDGNIIRVIFRHTAHNKYALGAMYYERKRDAKANAQKQKNIAAISVKKKKTTSESRNPKQGGSYSEVRRANGRPGWDVHHLVQRRLIPFMKLTDGNAPSLHIDRYDHELTLSNGFDLKSEYYFQEMLAAVRRGEYRSVLARDIANIRSFSGAKYNKGLLEAIKYAKTLPQFQKNTITPRHKQASAPKPRKNQGQGVLFSSIIPGLPQLIRLAEKGAAALKSNAAARKAAKEETVGNKLARGYDTIEAALKDNTAWPAADIERLLSSLRGTLAAAEGVKGDDFADIALTREDFLNLFILNHPQEFLTFLQTAKPDIFNRWLTDISDYFFEPFVHKQSQWLYNIKSGYLSDTWGLDTKQPAFIYRGFKLEIGNNITAAEPQQIAKELHKGRYPKTYVGASAEYSTGFLFNYFPQRNSVRVEGHIHFEVPMAAPRPVQNPKTIFALYRIPTGGDNRRLSISYDEAEKDFYLGNHTLPENTEILIYNPYRSDWDIYKTKHSQDAEPTLVKTDAVSIEIIDGMTLSSPRRNLLSIPLLNESGAVIRNIFVNSRFTPKKGETLSIRPMGGKMALVLSRKNVKGTITHKELVYLSVAIDGKAVIAGAELEKEILDGLNIAHNKMWSVFSLSVLTGFIGLTNLLASSLKISLGADASYLMMALIQAAGFLPTIASAFLRVNGKKALDRVIYSGIAVSVAAMALPIMSGLYVTLPAGGLSSTHFNVLLASMLMLGTGITLINVAANPRIQASSSVGRIMVNNLASTMWKQIFSATLGVAGFRIAASMFGFEFPVLFPIYGALLALGGYFYHKYQPNTRATIIGQKSQKGGDSLVKLVAKNRLVRDSTIMLFAFAGAATIFNSHFTLVSGEIIKIADASAAVNNANALLMQAGLYTSALILSRLLIKAKIPAAVNKILGNIQILDNEGDFKVVGNVLEKATLLPIISVFLMYTGNPVLQGAAVFLSGMGLGIVSPVANGFVSKKNDANRVKISILRSLADFGSAVLPIAAAVAAKSFLGVSDTGALDTKIFIIPQLLLLAPFVFAKMLRNGYYNNDDSAGKNSADANLYTSLIPGLPQLINRIKNGLSAIKTRAAARKAAKAAAAAAAEQQAASGRININYDTNLSATSKRLVPISVIGTDGRVVSRIFVDSKFKLKEGESLLITPDFNEKLQKNVWSLYLTKRTHVIVSKELVYTSLEVKNNAITAEPSLEREILDGLNIAHNKMWAVFSLAIIAGFSGVINLIAPSLQMALSAGGESSFIVMALIQGAGYLPAVASIFLKATNKRGLDRLIYSGMAVSLLGMALPIPFGLYAALPAALTAPHILVLGASMFLVGLGSAFVGVASSPRIQASSSVGKMTRNGVNASMWKQIASATIGAAGFRLASHLFGVDFPVLFPIYGGLLILGAAAYKFFQPGVRNIAVKNPGQSHENLAQLMTKNKLVRDSTLMLTVFAGVSTVFGGYVTLAAGSIFADPAASAAENNAMALLMQAALYTTGMIFSRRFIGLKINLPQKVKKIIG